MLRNARAALTAVALAILFLCGSPEPSRAAPAEPRFEPTPCPFTPAESGGALVECGQLVVPENRTAPESRLLRLAVTILRASGPEAKRDPIVYLSGGPGSAESSAVSRWLDHPLRGSRDFVLFDQRGTGRSGALCPELFRGVMGILARDLDLEADEAAHRALALTCLRKLQAQGIDVAQYQSASSAADLRDLRQALGYERLNLLGISYGSRLALTAARQLEASVRSLVLISPLGPEADMYQGISAGYGPAVDRLSADCADVAECRAEVSSVRSELLALLAEVDARPIVVEVDDRASFPDGKVVLNRQDILMLFGELLSSDGIRAVLPAFVTALRRGETGFLPALLRVFAHAYADIDLGMYYAVQCQEELPFSKLHASPRPADPFALPHVGILGAITGVCSDWQLTPAPAGEAAPVKSSLPALVVTGELDPRTPPAYARSVVEHLPNGHAVVLPGKGHGPAREACLDQLVTGFVNEPRGTPSTTCVATLKPQPPIASVHVKGGVLRSLALLRSAGPMRLLWPGAALLTLALSLLAMPVLWFWRRKTAAPLASEKSQHTPWWRNTQLVRASVGLAALCAWGFTLGVAFSVGRLIAADRAALLLLGLPAGASALFVLPKAVALFTLAAAGSAALSWRTPRWSRAARVFDVLGIAASAAFVAFLVVYGLF